MKLINKLSIIHWLLLTTFLNGIIFMMVTPIWHGPDEQAHFAQLQYYSEKRKLFPKNVNATTSLEVLLTQKLLGTQRDTQGNNMFTHNSNYRIEYTNSTIGKHENTIRQITLPARTTLVIKESTNYPPLFYIIGAIFYLIAYPFSLIERVFLVRLASVLIGVLTVWISYKTSKLVFPRNNLFAYTIAVLVSFQPMLSFLSASVNSDNLMNLLFSLLLYLCTSLVITKKFVLKNVITIIVIFILGLATKPHFIIALPIIILAVAMTGGFIKQLKENKSIAYLFALLLTVTTLFRLKGTIITAITTGQIHFNDVSLKHLTQPQNSTSLISHTLWTLRHTIAEVIPWYWGVFNWLGVTLPRAANRTINRLMIISAIGLLIWVYQNFRTLFHNKKHKAIIFFASSSIIFAVTLMLWDWLFLRGHGFSFGMQGRYYFPTIIPHMTLLLIGLVSLVPKHFSSISHWWTKIIGAGMILLNFIGVHTLASSYYQLLPVHIFFNQVSQYKPIIFKFPYLLIWITLYFACLTIFITRYFAYANSSRGRLKKNR